MIESVVLILVILGVAIGAIAIWLTVRVMNGQQSAKCGLWGIGVLVFGSAVFTPYPFSFLKSPLDSVLALPFVICILGFVGSYGRIR